MPKDRKGGTQDSGEDIQVAAEPAVDAPVATLDPEKLDDAKDTLNPTQLEEELRERLGMDIPMDIPGADNDAAKPAVGADEENVEDMVTRVNTIGDGFGPRHGPGGGPLDQFGKNTGGTGAYDPLAPAGGAGPGSAGGGSPSIGGFEGNTDSSSGGGAERPGGIGGGDQSEYMQSTGPKLKEYVPPGAKPREGQKNEEGKTWWDNVKETLGWVKDGKVPEPTKPDDEMPADDGAGGTTTTGGGTGRVPISPHETRGQPVNPQVDDGSGDAGGGRVPINDPVTDPPGAGDDGGAGGLTARPIGRFEALGQPVNPQDDDNPIPQTGGPPPGGGTSILSDAAAAAPTAVPAGGAPIARAATPDAAAPADEAPTVAVPHADAHDFAPQADVDDAPAFEDADLLDKDGDGIPG